MPLDARTDVPTPRVAFVDVVTDATVSSEASFERALSLDEAEDVEGACAAYRAVLRDNHRHLHAHINLGRCLHANGRLAEAEATYRQGLARCGPNEMLLFNLAIVLEDLHRLERLESGRQTRRGCCCFASV